MVAAVWPAAGGHQELSGRHEYEVAIGQMGEAYR